MRFYEFKTIKPSATYTANAKINALKQAKDRAAEALTAERTRQKQAKAQERVQKAQQALAKTKIT